MQTNRLGLELSTASAEAARHYSEGIDAYLCEQPGAEEHFEQALQVDPHFALASFGLGRQQPIRGATGPAYRSFLRAFRLGAAASEREREHMRVAVAAELTPGTVALPLATDYLDRHPKDLAILGQVVGVLFFRGGRGKRAAAVRLLERARPHLEGDWFFLDKYAFALKEAGDAAAATPLAEQAVAANPNNIGALHTRAHLLQEAGDLTAASSLLDQTLATYRGGLRGHLFWHRLLIEEEQLRFDRALELFSAEVRPGAHALGWAGLKLADAAGLFWRMRLADREVPAGVLEEGRQLAVRLSRRVVAGRPSVRGWVGRGLWRGSRALTASPTGFLPGMLAALGTNLLSPPPVSPFVALHAMALLSMADPPEARQLLSRLEARAAGEQSAEGAADARVVAQCARALLHFAEGQCAEVARDLEGVALEALDAMGGSVIERDLIELTRLEAHRRCGRPELVAEQLGARRPRPRDRLVLAQLALQRGEVKEARAQASALAQSWRDADQAAPEVLALAALQGSLRG